MEVGDGPAARGLAQDGHTLGVSPEPRDVGVGPLQRRHQVPQPLAIIIIITTIIIIIITWFPGASGMPRSVKPKGPSLWLGCTRTTSLSTQLSGP